jgi:DNA-directed RNA polymerase sigma subunit (sigma70/sigma32)
MVDPTADPPEFGEQARIVRLPLNKIGSINKINKAFAQVGAGA